MKPKWQKLASLAQKICTLKFQFIGAFFASKGYPFTSIFIWAATRQNLSSVFPTKQDSKQSPLLVGLARKLKFHL